jgi:hypothetical protein
MKKTAADRIRYPALMKYLQWRLEDDIAALPLYQSHRLLRVDLKIDCEAVLCTLPNFRGKIWVPPLSVNDSISTLSAPQNQTWGLNHRYFCGPMSLSLRRSHRARRGRPRLTRIANKPNLTSAIRVVHKSTSMASAA